MHQRRRPPEPLTVRSLRKEHGEALVDPSISRQEDAASSGTAPNLNPAQALGPLLKDQVHAFWRKLNFRDQRIRDYELELGRLVLSLVPIRAPVEDKAQLKALFLRHGSECLRFVSTESFEWRWKPCGACEREGRGSDSHSVTAHDAVDRVARCVVTPGEYEEGTLQGYGKLVCIDGRVYEGECRRGERHGYGSQVMIPTGQKGDANRLFVGGIDGMYRVARYEGPWCKNGRTGKGCLVYPGGDRIYGELKEGRLEGVCTWHYHGSCRKKRVAMYERGERVRWISDVFEDGDDGVEDPNAEVVAWVGRGKEEALGRREAEDNRRKEEKERRSRDKKDSNELADGRTLRQKG